MNNNQFFKTIPSLFFTSSQMSLVLLTFFTTFLHFSSPAQAKSGSFQSSPIILPSSTTSLSSLSWRQQGLPSKEGETLINPQGLIAAWNFNENQGSQVKSAVNCNNENCTGELVNFSPESLNGPDQNYFSGWTKNDRKWGAGSLKMTSKNQLQLPPSQISPQESGYSLGFWFQINPQDKNSTASASISATSNTPRPLLHTTNTSFTNSEPGYYLGLNTENQLNFRLNLPPSNTQSEPTSNSIAFTSSESISLSSWNYLSLNLDPEGDIQLFLNGISLYQTKFDWSSLIDNSNSFNQPILIGGGQTESQSWTIDSLHFFNRPLSATEVAANSHRTQLTLRLATFDPNTDPTPLLDQAEPLQLDNDRISCKSDTSPWQTCHINLDYLPDKKSFSYRVELMSPQPELQPLLSGFNLNYQTKDSNLQPLPVAATVPLETKNFAAQQTQVNAISRAIVQDLGTTPPKMPALTWEQLGVSSPNYQLTPDQLTHVLSSWGSLDQNLASNSSQQPLNSTPLYSLELSFTTPEIFTTAKTLELLTLSPTETLILDNEGHLIIGSGFVTPTLYLNGLDLTSQLEDLTLEPNHHYLLTLITPNSFGETATFDQYNWSNLASLATGLRFWDKLLTPAEIVSQSQNVTLEMQTRTSPDGLIWSPWSSSQQSHRLLWEDFEPSSYFNQRSLPTSGLNEDNFDTLLRTNNYQSLHLNLNQNNKLNLNLKPLTTIDHNRLTFYATTNQPLVFNVNLKNSKATINPNLATYQLQHQFATKLQKPSLVASNLGQALTQTQITLQDYDQLASLLPGDTILITEKVGDQTYLVQGVIDHLLLDQQAVVVKNWSGQVPPRNADICQASDQNLTQNQSFFCFSQAAQVLKWQKYYLDFNQVDPHLNSFLDQIEFDFTLNASQSANNPQPEFWLDEIEAYQLEQSAAITQKMTVNSPIGRYFQTQAIITSQNLPLSAQFSALTLAQSADANPSLNPNQRLRGGKGFLGNLLSPLNY